jgi:LysR family transcriptional regulator, cys regulon transcriptional activator
MDETFAQAGLAPDLIKTCVELGLGVGIVASLAFDAVRDAGLTRPASEHLFRRNASLIALRRRRHLRSYAYRFIELCESSLTETSVKAAPRPAAEP